MANEMVFKAHDRITGVSSSEIIESTQKDLALGEISLSENALKLSKPDILKKMIMVNRLKNPMICF